MTTNSSKACRETPAAVSEGYEAQGSYQTISDTRCYIIGPSDATRAIFYLYDVFGFTEQTLQGADILASKGTRPYLVIIPDLFDGKPIQPEWFARDTEEKKQKIDDFMAAIRNPTPYIERIHRIFDAAVQKFPGVERWGTIGYCWGGKLVALTSGADTKWSVGVMTSPARVDPEDAKKIAIPFATLASKGENTPETKEFHRVLAGPNTLHVFEDQVHGWMSARADLKDPKVKQEYERGYELTLDFYAQHL